MKNLLSFIVKSIVASPGKVTITEAKEGQGVKFTINLPQEEVGAVIGQQGKIIKAIKTILVLKARGKRFFIEVSEK